MNCKVMGKKPRLDGYVMVYYKGWRVRAHRLAWEKVNGPIPEGFLVLHSCDNRSCVNVKHLFLGTHADNSRDMAGKMRSTIGSRNPASRLTEYDVRNIRALLSMGHMQCTIAKEYGVSRSAISMIATGMTWAWLV